MTVTDVKSSTAPVQLPLSSRSPASSGASRREAEGLVMNLASTRTERMAVALSADELDELSTQVLRLQTELQTKGHLKTKEEVGAIRETMDWIRRVIEQGFYA